MRIKVVRCIRRILFFVLVLTGISIFGWIGGLETERITLLEFDQYVSKAIIFGLIVYAIRYVIALLAGISPKGDYL